MKLIDLLNIESNTNDKKLDLVLKVKVVANNEADIDRLEFLVIPYSFISDKIQYLLNALEEVQINDQTILAYKNTNNRITLESAELIDCVNFWKSLSHGNDELPNITNG